METITYEDFVKCDIRTGCIIAAESIPKSKKMINLTVSFGELGNRTILAGIAKDFTPEALVGRLVVAVINLAPRPMFGIESHGMILAAPAADGQLSLVYCAGALPGTQVG
jgi:methionyl-tRNA synthetase